MIKEFYQKIKRFPQNNKFLIIVFIYLIYFFVNSYNLTNASLWFDETIEYYYSKFMFGLVPGGGNTINMYERIISTFQPPLYNIIMFFWLKINDSEWWFRFSSVFFGSFGLYGIYKSILIIKNFNWAVISSLVYSFIYRVVYFNQECAEYSLMLAFVSFSIYYFISIFNEKSRKNTWLFILFCILAVYSQYGAIILVSALSITLVIWVIKEKDWVYLKKLIIYFELTAITAVSFLYFFFLKFQIRNQLGNQSTRSLHFWKSFFIEYKNIFKWGFLPYPNDFINFPIIEIILLIILCLVVFSIYKMKNKVFNYLIFANLITWVIYYILTFFGIFAYGKFSVRYNLFFIPLQFITIVYTFSSFNSYLLTIKNTTSKKIRSLNINFSNIYIILLFLFISTYCSINFYFIYSNWEKEDIRGVVNTWIDLNGWKEKTIIYYAAESGFMYYLNHSAEYLNESNLNENLIFSASRDLSLYEYNKDFESKIDLNTEDNQKIYFVASHYRDDLDTMLQFFINNNYKIETVYSGEKAELILLTSITP